MATPEEMSAELEAYKKEVQTLTKQLDEHAPEAIYAVSIDRSGNPLFTIRARPGEPLDRYAFRVDQAIKKFSAMGIIKSGNAEQAPAASQPQPVANGTTPQPPQDANGGTAHAVLMKVGLSYTGNKPQLQFECDGMEHPLSFTRPVADMIKLLAAVGKYTPEMLANGKKYGVDYLVDWQLGEPNAEGKRYRNIVAVRPTN